MIPLRGSPVGTCVPISGHDSRFNESYEVDAFLPNDLPTDLELPSEVWLKVTEAATELARLDAAASLVPNPTLITRIATRREAIGTSALEGTFANLAELLVTEASPDVEDKDIPPNVREVMNYTRAADAGYGWVVDHPITIHMLSSLQQMIVRGTDSDGPEAGAMRERQVFIGAQHVRVRDVRFVPPPPGDQLRALLERWTNWLTEAQRIGQIHTIARLALAHYQFETIHPFVDGNGRLGRLVAVLQLMREGHLRAPVLSLSPWLKDNASEYRDHLLNVSRSGDWAPWIDFFAQAVAAQSRDGHDRIMRLLDLKAEIGQQVRSSLPHARLAVEIADDLIAFPIISVSDCHARYGHTNQANRNAVGRLLDVGVLEPFSEARYGRLYWNRRVFQIIEGNNW